MLPTVTIHEGNGWRRFTVKEDPYGWLEAWRYQDSRADVFAYQCTPIRALPDNAAGLAIRAAMDVNA